MTEQGFEAERRRKNLALLAVLAGLAVLLFFLTIVKFGQGGPPAG